jgi:shikimate kinase
MKGISILSVPSKHVFLTGFMGSGKTTVGRRLAQRLGLSFIDLDQEIEKRECRLIRDIFAQYGEAFFRRLESDVLRSICSNPTSAVVATGGGIIINPENRLLMRSSGLIVNFQVDYASVAQRLAKDQSRPLLKNKDENAITALMTERMAAYADADMVIDTAQKTPQQIVSDIIRWLNQ